ncbi:metal ABC transporter substrate-binding protein, partial [Mesorhizobium sp. M00.F.Ca.ET.186.01.1.1]
MKKWNLFLVFLISSVLLAACGAPQSSNQEVKTGNEKLHVVTTYSILYDIVKNVGGDRVEIHSLAPL